VLFTVASPVQTPTGQQPSLAVLRSMDGSPAQTLGEGEALDLSPDGRWALVRTDGRQDLVALPTGAGAARAFPLGELRVWNARWMPDGQRIILTARSGSGPFQIHELDPDRSPLRRVSEVPLGTRQVLVLSPDGLLAAAVDVDDRVAVVSLSDGARIPVSGIPPGAWPRGWAGPRQLWLTEGADLPAATRLFRLDIDSGKVLEERRFGPPDSAGAAAIAFVQLSEGAREVAYTYNR